MTSKIECDPLGKIKCDQFYSVLSIAFIIMFAGVLLVASNSIGIQTIDDQVKKELDKDKYMKDHRTNYNFLWFAVIFGSIVVCCGSSASGFAYYLRYGQNQNN